MTRAGVLEWEMTHSSCFNSRQVQFSLSAVGFHDSGSRHSGLSSTPSMWVATSMEAPLSDWKQVWGSRS
jgi:hypothetical protein